MTKNEAFHAARQKSEAIRGRAGEPVREIARSYNVSHSTIFRLAAYILCSRTPSNGATVKVFRSTTPAAKARPNRRPVSV